ncbi:MAG: orotidine-5'-phosphate decarboxylase, partial [Betaproteobacteria bacterium]|nr:orotidine-5'-phosphate decarboxylase [Betaproteobacteria bacterium]
MNPKVIVALDYSDEESLMTFVNRVSPELCGLKVG